MTFTNSSLVDYTKISPNKTSPRNHKIDTITIHCVVGQCSVEALGDIFTPTSRQASSNYGIGYDGKVGMYVEERDRSWCSSNSENDNRAVTIEVASDTTHPYAVNDVAYNKLIELVADICKRNEIKELKWRADASLIGQIDKQNMTVHRWFANKSCPGDYLYERHGRIAESVNALLSGTSTISESKDSTSNSSSSDIYESIEVKDILEFRGNKQYISANSNSPKAATLHRVRVVDKVSNKYYKHPILARSVDISGNYISGIYGWVDSEDLVSLQKDPYRVKVVVDSLNYRRGPSISYPVLGTIEDKGVYTIVEEVDGWGKLKSNVGWINLNYTKKL